MCVVGPSDREEAKHVKGSVSESSNYIEDHGQNHTQQDGRRQREIESSVLTAIDNVAGQSSDGKIGAPNQNKYQSYSRENHAEEQQHLANIGHNPILKAKGLHRCEGLYAKVSAKT